MKNRIKILGQDGAWVSGLVLGCFFMAKIYDEPSQFGINEGRISKLAICNDSKWDADKLIYNFDRGADVDGPAAQVFTALLLEEFA